MKKSIILMAGLVGLALTSCDDKSDLGTMQKNEAPIVVPADGVAIQSLYVSTGNQVNLQDYEESVYVPLIDIELSTKFPESSVVSGEVEIADNADFKNAVTVELGSVESPLQNAALANAISGDTRSLQGYVEMTAWENAFTTFYGMNPAPNVNYMRYKLWLTNDTQKLILYNQNGEEWWDTMEFMVTPLDAGLDVKDSYTFNYMLNNEGDIQTVVMFHNPDKHVYDDPNFTATFEVPEGADNVIYWWISPADDEATAYGVAGSDPAVLKGNLALISEEEGETASNGQVSNPGVYKISANMLGLTYEIQLAPPSLYVMYTGGVFDNVAQLGTDDKVLYTGMAGLLGKWVLTGQNKYVPTLYVNDEAVANTEEGGTTTGGLMFSDGGATAASNFGIPNGSSGLYYITANLQTLKWTRYRCATMGITGSMEAQDWGAGPDVELKGSRSTIFMEWTGTLTVAAGNEWKIRANSDWAVNFGAAGDGSYTADGQPIELSMNGANFVAAEDGTYNVTVYLKRQLVDGKMTPYYMTLTPAE